MHQTVVRNALNLLDFSVNFIFEGVFRHFLLSLSEKNHHHGGFHGHRIQSGASSQAKIGGAYFSGVTGSIQDPIAIPGPCEVTEC